MSGRALLGVAVLMTVVAGCVDDAAPAAVLDPSAYVVPDVPAVDAEALLAEHAEFVRANPLRQNNAPTHESARVDLLAAFASYGLETYRQNFTDDGLDQANIVGIKWGHVRDQWVVVSSHYDTTTDDCAIISVDVVTSQTPLPTCPMGETSQGAYDDGSGTYMVVHLAKAFANVTPYYTIAFAALDGEERGTQGAAAFVNQIHVEHASPYGAIRIIANLDLDMVGLNWPGVQAPLNVLSNSETALEIADAKRLEMGWPDEQWRVKDGLALGSSDYARFWEVEEPAPIATMFFIADFEELGVCSPAPENAYTPAGAYPFWHAQDTVETMTAMACGQENLEAGFQSAVDVAAHVLHAMALQPTVVFEAEAK